MYLHVNLPGKTERLLNSSFMDVQTMKLNCLWSYFTLLTNTNSLSVVLKNVGRVHQYPANQVDMMDIKKLKTYLVSGFTLYTKPTIQLFTDNVNDWYRLKYR